MSKSDSEITKIVQYMKAHWPSMVKKEWQVDLSEYLNIAKKVFFDFTQGKTRGKKIIRIAGISGSGKTTQLLPAAEAYFEKENAVPVLVAARRFVEYHPHYEDILKEYGDENLRKMTDEFATIMMFLAIGELIKNGFDIILDVTLLDPEMEAILLKMLESNGYSSLLLIIAASPEITEKFLGGRAWRHTKETEQEFIRATEKALDFYKKQCLDMRIVIWNTFDVDPIYDGHLNDEAIQIFQKFSDVTEIPEHDEKILKEAKILYLVG